MEIIQMHNEAAASDKSDVIEAVSKNLDNLSMLVASLVYAADKRCDALILAGALEIVYDRICAQENVLESLLA